MSDTPIVDGGHCTPQPYLEMPIEPPGTGDRAQALMCHQAQSSDFLQSLGEDISEAAPDWETFVSLFEPGIQGAVNRAVETGKFSVKLTVLMVESMWEHNSDEYLSNEVNKAMESGNYELVRGVFAGLTGVDNDGLDCIHEDASDGFVQGLILSRKAQRTDPAGFRTAETAFQTVYAEFMAGACSAVEGWDDANREPAFHIGREMVVELLHDPSRTLEAEAFRQDVQRSKTKGYSDRESQQIDENRLRFDAAYRSGVSAAGHDIDRYGFRWTEHNAAELEVLTAFGRK